MMEPTEEKTNFAERRGFIRIAPKTQEAQITLASGVEAEARVLNLSLSGISLSTSGRVPLEVGDSVDVCWNEVTLAAIVRWVNDIEPERSAGLEWASDQALAGAAQEAEAVGHSPRA